MNKHDRVFIFLVLVSVAFLSTVIAENLSARPELAANQPTPEEKDSTVSTASAKTAETDQADVVRKKFASMGLKPHEGAYWKSAK